MKYCILTPTFVGHFQYLKNYLTSFNRNVLDKDNCIIYFIINENENKKLEKIISNYQNLNIKILHFENILQHFGIIETPEMLLDKYGKFSFQALKKFYGMLYLEKYQQFLVLDTESIWLNKCYMSNLFENFFNKSPFIIYSNINKRKKVSISNQEASDNINYILNTKCDKWFVEQYVRFWDVNILKDIFFKYGSCYDIVNKIYKKELNFEPKLGLFESVLYDQFIFENNDKYNYKLVDLDIECEKYINIDTLEKYRNDMARIWRGSCGLLESSSILLDKFNYLGFANVFSQNGLNVIRIETNAKNYKWQKKFLDIVQPDILTCSQENLFGVNNNFSNWYNILIGQCVYYKKLKKHLSMLMKPFGAIFHWLTKTVAIIFDILMLFFEFVKMLIYVIK